MSSPSGPQPSLSSRVDSEAILPQVLSPKDRTSRGTPLQLPTDASLPLDSSQAPKISARSDGPQPQVSKATSGGSHLGVMSTGTIGQQPGLSRRENTSQSEQGVGTATVTGSWVSGSSDDSDKLKVPGRDGSQRPSRRGSTGMLLRASTAELRGASSPSVSKEKSGRGDRKGSVTNRRGSGSRSRAHKSKASRRDSTEYYDDSSGSDEWDDEANIKSGPRANFMPLYKMDGAIKVKGEYKAPEVISQESTRTESDSVISYYDPPPPVSIVVSTCVLQTAVVTILCWAALAVSFLLCQFIRFFGAVREDAQRQAAESALLSLEAGVASAMASAVRITRSLHIAAVAGLLMSGSYADIGYILARDMAANPAVEVVKVAGYHTRAVEVRPGDLHVNTVAARLRHPIITEMGIFCEHEEAEFPIILACLGRHNDTQGFLPLPPGVAITSRWSEPHYVTLGRFGQPLEADEWVRTRSLTATIDAGTTHLATEVAMNLDALVQPARDAAPVGGTVIVCDAAGTLLATSGRLTDVTGSMGSSVFPRLWEISSIYPWVSSISAEVLASEGRFETWHDSDLIIVRPAAALQSEVSATDPSLRFIVFAHRDSAVSALLRVLMFSTIVVAAIPAFVLCCAGPVRAIRRCRQRDNDYS
mmetsp:Transcript_56812/g.133426  ORF Transcript_56812/g.133426 Transcript_56812/m.133426 type:complete len:646 (-) Transcript_56812:68-2005(-)